MNNEYNLKEVKLTSETIDNKTYTLDFSNGETKRTISLSGKGKLKEAVKI